MFGHFLEDFQHSQEICEGFHRVKSMFFHEKSHFQKNFWLPSAAEKRFQRNFSLGPLENGGGIFGFRHQSSNRHFREKTGRKFLGGDFQPGRVHSK